MENRVHFVEVLSAIGNRNILSGYIKILTERLDKRSQPFNIGKDMDYFCWLLLKSIYIAWEIEHKYLRHNSEIKPVEKISFEKKLDFLKGKIHSRSEFHYIKGIIELRDRLVHLGLPNTIVEPKDKNVLKMAINGDYTKMNEIFRKSETILMEVNDPTIFMNGLGKIG